MPKNLPTHPDASSKPSTESSFWTKAKTQVGPLIVGVAGSVLAYVLTESWATRISLPLSILIVAVGVNAAAVGWLLQYRRSHRILKSLEKLTGFVRIDETLGVGEGPKEWMGGG